MPQKDPGPRPKYDNLCFYLHELAQPLSTVTGLIDLLLLEMDEQDKIFKEVKLISEQLGKILNIIGEIREIAREPAEREARSLKPRPPSFS
jgi:signal transduction histidine kinase